MRAYLVRLPVSLRHCGNPWGCGKVSSTKRHPSCLFVLEWCCPCLAVVVVTREGCGKASSMKRHTRCVSSCSVILYCKQN